MYVRFRWFPLYSFSSFHIFFSRSHALHKLFIQKGWNRSYTQLRVYYRTFTKSKEKKNLYRVGTHVSKCLVYIPLLAHTHPHPSSTWKHSSTLAYIWILFRWEKGTATFQAFRFGTFCIFTCERKRRETQIIFFFSFITSFWFKQKEGNVEVWTVRSAIHGI